MKLSTIATLSACGLAALTAASFALPRHVSVERVALLDASPVAIIALAASNDGYQRFNPYKTRDPELTVALYGPESGVGSGFEFDSKDGTGRQTVSDVTEKSVTYAIDLAEMGSITQSIRAEPAEEGSAVTWSMQADMGFNPLFRVMGLFMDGMIGPTFELGLENLADAAA